MSQGITIKVKNYGRYRGRSDVKHNTWFRCEIELLEDPDFYDFSFEEILVWIRILSQCAKKNTDTILVHFEESLRKCRLTKVAIISAIEKLSAKKIISIEDDTYTLRTRTESERARTDSDRVRTESVRTRTVQQNEFSEQEIAPEKDEQKQVDEKSDTCTLRARTESERVRTDSVRPRTATLQDITLQDTTLHYDTDTHPSDESAKVEKSDEGGPEPGPSKADALPPLVDIWNDHCGILPKVVGVGKSRAPKIKQRGREASLDEWKQVVIRIADSDFCKGNNDRGWVATFDWLLKPDTRLKVLEGKYDNRLSNYASTSSQRASSNNAKLMEKIRQGEFNGPRK